MNVMNGLSEADYEKMTKEEKIKWLTEQREKLDAKQYGSEGDDMWETFDEDFDDEGIEDDECFGKYLEMESESCEVCGIRKECMAEMPSKFDEVLRTMGVDIER